MAKKWGDRRDGTLLRDIDSMHYIMPLMYPNRCDNEAFIHSKPTDNINSIHDEIYRQVSYVRHEGKDPSTESMDALQRLPLFLKKGIGAGARFLDRHGWMPQSVIATDPFQSSVVLANLGSIKLHSGYHHLTNWGTTSVFCIIGEMKKRPFHADDGSVEMRMSIDIGLTVDERISDGFYCSRAVRSLHLGKPVRFDASAPIDRERRRICEAMMDGVTELARALPEHTVVPYPNVAKKQYPRNKEPLDEKTCG